MAIAACGENPIAPNDVRVEFTLGDVVTEDPSDFQSIIRKGTGSVTFTDTIRYWPGLRAEASVERIAGREVVIAVTPEPHGAGITVLVTRVYELEIKGLPKGVVQLKVWERHPHEQWEDYLQFDTAIHVERD